MAVALKQKKLVVGGAKSDVVFDLIVKLIVIFTGLATFYPLYYVIISSISDGIPVDIGAVILYPMDADRNLGANLASFENVLAVEMFWISFANTFFYTIIGTAYSMLITTTAAYALSRSQFKIRKPLNLAISFTLWFNAGFIPHYLNYKDLGVIDDRWGIIVSFGVQAFFVILMRNYFEAVPKELEEAARIDGANEFRIFSGVYLPLAGPALVTIAIYYAVSRWNSFFWAMVLLRQQELIPLQVYLRQMIIQEQLMLDNQGTIAGQLYSFTTLKYALIVCSMIPIIIVFPMIQRYFAKGVMLGGVKE